MPIWTHPEYLWRIESEHQPSCLEWELACYRNGLSVKQGGLGLAGHFKKIVEILWGPKSLKHFIWHPWAEKMNETVHEHPLTGKAYPHVAISSCGSGGKTDFGAVYANVNWLCDPINTLVLCTSTDLKASRKRIWGSIVQYYQPIVGCVPGKLVDSQGIIRTDDGSGVFNDKAGIALIAGEKKKEKEAIGKLIGSKNKRVILLADELCELTEAILEAAFSNLVTNPFFQMVAFANFKSRYDPFGVFAEPVNGYDSITVDDEEWETRRGWALHFDGMKSPNILEGRDIWPIYGSKQLAAHKKDLGENSALFWRMCRSFEAPVGIDATLYAETDLKAGLAYERVDGVRESWLGDRTRVSGLDPSFTNGGDRCVQWFGWLGKLNNGLTVLEYDRLVLLREDVTRQRARDYQIVDQFQENCEREGVKPYHAAIDASGAGSVLYSIVCELWSHEVLAVEFGGAPSDLVVSFDDGKSAREKYDRRVSELWGVGVEFVRHKQIRGVSTDMAREMKARQYESKKRGDNVIINVETKKDLKVRLGFSPDIADAGFVMLELCRQRLGFTAGGNIQNGHTMSLQKMWKNKAMELDSVYDAVYD